MNVLGFFKMARGG